MAININSQAVPPKELHDFKDRDYRWLWNFLAAKGLGPQLARDHYSSIHVARTIATLIAGNQRREELLAEIVATRKASLVPDESLHWIDKNDDRLLIWLYLALEDHKGTNGQPLGLRPLALLPAERRREEIVLAIDMAMGPIPRKQEWLSVLKKSWGQQRTPDRDTKWLDPKSDVQMTWAWSYIGEEERSRRIPQPVSTRERHTAVLAALDQMSLLHPAEKRLFLEQFKKAWSQKKFRDSGKAKKPYHLPLTLRAKAQLEWLATTQGIKETAILERLIQESFTTNGGKDKE